MLELPRLCNAVEFVSKVITCEETAQPRVSGKQVVKIWLVFDERELQLCFANGGWGVVAV